MSKAKKIWKVGSWTGGIVFLLFLLGFAGEKREQTPLKRVVLTIANPSGQRFITPTDLDQLIAAEADTTSNTPIEEINIQLLEESIENHPLIDHAEVYSNLSGSLFVDIVQKEALARVLGETERFYIDGRGNKMPLSSHYSAPVPLVTGRIDSLGIQRSLMVLNECKRSQELWSLLAGVDVRKDLTVVLYTRLGAHEVLIGDATSLDDKIRMLIGFYKYGIDQSELPQVKRIDLRFNKQVIVQKKQG